jgi:hypothetical protein
MVKWIDDEIYLYHNRLFYPYCGMQLRLTTYNIEDKERLRQDRTIAKMTN